MSSRCWRISRSVGPDTQQHESKLEVLIEKGGAAVSCVPCEQRPFNLSLLQGISCDANRTTTVCTTVEHMNFFY